MRIAALVILTLACAGRPGPARAESDARRTPVVVAVERTRPAVVNVFTETLVQTPFRTRRPGFGNPLFDDFFSDLFPRPSQPRQRRSSLGSGVVIDADGTIVTNEHVIVHASNIKVLLADKRELTARLVGADSDSDLAVLKVEADEPFPSVTLAGDDTILIGETVIAIGNPFGLSHTVTTGVVSAVGRTIQAGDVVYHDFIQTDASINPGNSGGPLLNIEGELLGINTAIHRTAENIGFAIPVRRVRSVAEQLVHYGAVQSPWIGIQVQDLTPELAFHFQRSPQSGVVVSSIDPGSPAATAGLTPGDVIVGAHGEPVRSGADFARRTRGLEAGEELRLEIAGEQGRRTITLVVAVLPADRIDEFAWRALGVEVEDSRSGRGVAVTRVRRDGPAHRIGMQRGDVIAEVGGREIGDEKEFRRKLATFRNKNNLLISVVRGRRLYRVTVPLDRRS